MKGNLLRQRTEEIADLNLFFQRGKCGRRIQNIIFMNSNLRCSTLYVRQNYIFSKTIGFEKRNQKVLIEFFPINCNGWHVFGYDTTIYVIFSKTYTTLFHRLTRKNKSHWIIS